MLTFLNESVRVCEFKVTYSEIYMGIAAHLGQEARVGKLDLLTILQAVHRCLAQVFQASWMEFLSSLHLATTSGIVAFDTDAAVAMLSFSVVRDKAELHHLLTFPTNVIVELLKQYGTSVVCTLTSCNDVDRLSCFDLRVKQDNWVQCWYGVVGGGRGRS